MRPDAKDDIKDVVVELVTVVSAIRKVGPSSDGRHDVGRAEEPDDGHGDEHGRAPGEGLLGLWLHLDHY